MKSGYNIQIIIVIIGVYPYKFIWVKINILKSDLYKFKKLKHYVIN